MNSRIQKTFKFKINFSNKNKKPCPNYIKLRVDLNLDNQIILDYYIGQLLWAFNALGIFYPTCSFIKYRFLVYKNRDPPLPFFRNYLLDPISSSTY